MKTSESFIPPAEETWRVFRIMSEFVEAFERLANIGPAVSVFGSAQARPSEHHYKLARETARLLARAGFGIITGGGPGIMEAANRGACEAGGKSIGLNIALPEEQEANRFQTLSMHFHYFFCRKVMFVKYASAFICFPGGFGTMDEFFESMTLIQTLKVPRFPVILMVPEFWKPLLEWMRTTIGQCYHAITPEDLKIATLCDDPEQALDLVQHAYEQQALAKAKAISTPFPNAQDLTPEGTIRGIAPRYVPLGPLGGKPGRRGRRKPK